MRVHLQTEISYSGNSGNCPIFWKGVILLSIAYLYE